PYYLSNFTLILVMRAIFGIGLGLLTPLGNALILGIFEGEARASMLGIGNVVSTLGGILLKLMAGFLAAIHWRYMFLTHLLGLVTLVAGILFLKEPEKVEQSAGLKVKLPGAVYLYGTVMALIFMALSPVLLGVSTIIIGEGLGDASDSAIVLAMFTTGAMTAGALFSRVYRIMKKFTVVFALFLAAIGLVILGYGPNLFLLGFGTYVTGTGMGTFIPGMMMDVGAVCRQDTFAFASGVVMSIGNGGGFIGPYYLSLVAFVFSNTSLRFAVYVGAVILVLLGVAFGIFKLKTPDVVVTELSESTNES
ncbi:MAG TPA: MFS transporter, partial [Firmicutes bacterium]|nr:MFS transporter [Bacillota bacterium]